MITDIAHVFYFTSVQAKLNKGWLSMAFLDRPHSNLNWIRIVCKPALWHCWASILASLYTAYVCASIYNAVQLLFLVLGLVVALVVITIYDSNEWTVHPMELKG